MSLRVHIGRKVTWISQRKKVVWCFFSFSVFANGWYRVELKTGYTAMKATTSHLCRVSNIQLMSNSISHLWPLAHNIWCLACHAVKPYVPGHTCCPMILCTIQGFSKAFVYLNCRHYRLLISSVSSSPLILGQTLLFIDFLDFDIFDSTLHPGLVF